MHTKLSKRLGAILLSALILAILLPALPAKAEESDEAKEALEWFRGCGEEVAARRKYFAQEPVDDQEVAYVMKHLPASVKSSIIEDAGAYGRVGRVSAPIAAYFDWERKAKVIIFKNDMPWTGFYGRAVLAVSTGALSLLTDDELRAILSHEYSHNLWPVEFTEEQQAGNHRALRIIELKCDALGLFYFYKTGGSLKTFLSALEKMNDHPLVPTSGPDHLCLPARRQFVIEVARILSIPS